MDIEKSVNFEMLRSQWPELATLGAKAESYVHTDPESCLVKLRNYLELIVCWLYRHERLEQGYRASLYDLIQDDVFRSVMPNAVLLKMDALRIHGNRAAHGDKSKAGDALWLLQEALYVGGWLFLTYGNGTKEALGEYAFPEAPKAEIAALTKKELQRKQEQLEQAKKELEEAQQQQISILQELKLQKERADEFQQRIAELRQRNEHVANVLELDESETRRRLIDSQLIATGWNVGENLQNTSQVTQEEPVKEQPTKSGDGYADYVIWDDKCLPMAVVEAKRTNTDAEKGRHQAKLYAD